MPGNRERALSGIPPTPAIDKCRQVAGKSDFVPTIHSSNRANPLEATTGPQIGAYSHGGPASRRQQAAAHPIGAHNLGALTV